MGEEIGRWLDAAKPGLPWAFGVLALVLLGYGLNAWIGRARLAEARRLAREAVAAEARAEHARKYVRNYVEPTQAIDMSPLVASAEKAKFNARSVLADVRERIAAAMAREQNPPDWTPEQLAEVKAMTDRSGWPNSTYQPRGFLPNLRPRHKTREEVRVEKVTPLQIGERIKRIKAEKKEKAA